MQNKIEFVSIFNLQVGLLGRVRFRRQAWAWMHDKPDDPNGDPTFPDIEGKTGVDFSGRFPLCNPGE
jgi:hypothetical protein